MNGRVLKSKWLMFITVFLLGSSFLCGVSFAENAKFAKIRASIKQQNYQQAFDKASKILDKNIGDPEFDMLYGEAALNTGNYSEAAFAYQRVIIIQPRNFLAHLQLALARYKQNKLDQADAELKLVLRANPPENVRKNIKKFQARIQMQRLVLTTGLPDTSVIQVRLGWQAGHDSNINSAASDPTISDLFVSPEVSLKGITLVTATPIGIEIPSDFFRYTGIVDVLKPIKWFEDKLDGKLTYFATAYGNYTDFRSDSPFDLGNYFFSNGLLYRTESNTFKLPIRLQALDLNSANLLRAISFAPEVIHTFNKRNAMGVAFEIGRLSYPNTKSLNQNQYFGTLIWQHFNPDKNYNWDLNLFAGDTQAALGPFVYNGRGFYGYRVYAEWRFRQNHALYTNIIDRISRFDMPANPAFVVTNRKERFQLYTVGWNWMFVKNWFLKTFVGFSRNRSSIDVYRFKRSEIGIGFEYRTDSLQWAAKRTQNQVAQGLNPASDNNTGISG